MAYRTFQSRLAKFHDPLRKKLIDNTLTNLGAATDCIRVRVKRTKQGDIESRVVEEASVIPIIFPPLVDVPYRRLTNEAGVYSLTTFPDAAKLFPIQIYSTQTDKLYMGDLIFRILRDPTITVPVVMVLETKEPLGTFGGEYLIYSKFNAVFYDEELPSELIEVVVSIAERRLELGW